MVIVNVKEMGMGNLSCDIKQIYCEDGIECMGDDYLCCIIGYYILWCIGKNGLLVYFAGDLFWEKLIYINYVFVSINKFDFSM